jgi:hypothetical protein
MPALVYGLCVVLGLNPLYTIAAVVCAAQAIPRRSPAAFAIVQPALMRYDGTLRAKREGWEITCAAP